MTALDTIIRQYVREELLGNDDIESRDANDNENAHYVQELHDCLERNGVMRELQGFLRHKLVALLGNKWPHLVSPSNATASGRVDLNVLALLQDFFRSRRLLFSLSVFAGELGLHEDQNNASFGKMSCHQAEELLQAVGLPKDSTGSRQVIQNYAGDEGGDLSLLEALIQLGPWSPNANDNDTVENDTTNHNHNYQHHKDKPGHTQFKDIDHLYQNQATTRNKEVEERRMGMEERLHAIQVELEKDKDLQVMTAINKFRSEEEAKIRQELEVRLEFELHSREKEFLIQFKERAGHLRESLEAEKKAWMEEKERQERELVRKQRQYEESIQSVPTRIYTKGSEDIAQPQRPMTLTYFKPASQRDDLRFERKEFEEQEVPTLPRNSVSEMDRDKLAFLQYNLEQQGEEIKSLKEQLLLRENLSQPTAVSTCSSNLVTFLSESKKRCLAIEEEARNLDKKLLEISKARRSRSASPRHTLPSMNQTPNANSILTRLLATHKDKVRTTPIPNLNIPLLSRPLLLNFPKPSTITSSSPTATRIIVTKKKKIVSESSQGLKSPATSPPKLSAGTSPENSVRVAVQRLRSENKLTAAVSRGALSFEKVSSSSEVEEQEEQETRSEIGTSPPSQHSSRRRISFSQENGNHGHEFPVKLVPDENNSEKSVSISVSGPKSTKDDSDFWRL